MDTNELAVGDSHGQSDSPNSGNQVWVSIKLVDPVDGQKLPGSEATDIRPMCV